MFVLNTVTYKISPAIQAHFTHRIHERFYILTFIICFVKKISIKQGIYRAMVRHGYNLFIPIQQLPHTGYDFFRFQYLQKSISRHIS